MKTKTTIHIRWFIKNDLVDVLEIERFGSRFPWDEDRIRELMGNRRIIGISAERYSGEYSGEIVAYIIYQLHKTHLEILRLIVHPEHRRSGVGRQMIAKMIGKLSHHRRTALEITVRETEMEGQLFLRAMGFKAIRVERGMYEDSGEDGYVMRYELE